MPLYPPDCPIENIPPTVHICGLCRFEIYAGEDCYDTPLGYICRECLSAYLQSIREVAQLAEQ